MQQVRQSPAYVFGHSEDELQRLITQSHAVESFTHQMFSDAGIAEGMSVLDLGCGPGDVSFLAAKFVGTSGKVVGIDKSQECIEVARERASMANLENVTFIRRDLAEMDLTSSFDAVVGRAVLMYVPDPVETLRQASGRVRPGGIIAFQEVDELGIRSFPESPLFESGVRWIIEAFKCSNIELQMGLRLHRVFVGAGLPAPRMTMSARVEAGPESFAYEYLAQSVRSVLPAIEKFGIASPDEVQIETLARRLRDEVTATGAVMVLPPLVAAWTRIAESPARGAH